MFGNDISFFYVFLGVYLCASSSTAELVSIGPERTFSRYATVESKQTRIFWNPAVEGLPQSAVDFQNAYSEGLWTTSLDGIGDRREQVLAVHWKESGDNVGFEMQLKFASNETHWFINQVVVQVGNAVTTGLFAPFYSNDERVGDRGHVVAAKKGFPFECHYLELPLIVVDFLTCGSAQFNTSLLPMKDLSSYISVGEVLGVFVMEDFLISGWEGGPSLKLVNRLEVEPCGLKHCGIQAMNRLVSSRELLLMNSPDIMHTKDATLDGERPVWYRFGQMKPWLPAVERVCGSQRDVDAMRHSHAFSARSSAVELEALLSGCFGILVFVVTAFIWT